MNDPSVQRPMPGPLPSGLLLAERFRIETTVGRGADGVVYRALDLSLDEPVALKSLHAEAHPDGRLDRLRRELQLARRVSHPNVCRLHDLVTTTHDGQTLVLLSMELLSGETLRSLLEQRRRLGVDESLDIVRQVAAGLDAAHAAGVVHGDLSARNVFLEEDSSAPRRVVITDFGLARSIRPSLSGDPTGSVWESTDEELAETLTEEIAGTPAYMAPELLRGRPASVASDVYALGVLAYEMRSGSLPFRGSTPFETALQRLVADPPPLQAGADDEVWRSAIASAMAREPERRPSSAGQFARALEPADGVGGSGRALFANRTPKRRAAIRLAAALALLALFSLIVALFSVVLLDDSAPPPERRPMERGAAGDVTPGAAAPQGPFANEAESRLAVLPFGHDDSGSASFLAYGLSQAVQRRLAELPRVGVLSPASAEVLAAQLASGGAGSVRSVAHGLGLRFVVEGTVSAVPSAASAAGTDAGGDLEAGDEIEVRVSLLDLELDRRLDAPLLRAPAATAFDLQGDIAEQVATWIRPQTGPATAERRLDGGPGTDDLQAFRSFARGHQLFHSTYGVGGLAQRREGLSRARRLFVDATQHDEDFAEAWAWAALCDVSVALLPAAGRPDLLTTALELAERALALDPELGEAHAVVGFVTGSRGDLITAEEAFRRALAARPGSALVRALRAQLLEQAHLWELAAEESARAAQLDPYNPILLQLAAGSFLVLRDWERADQAYRIAIERFPEVPIFYGGLAANLYYWTGDPAAAREVLDGAPGEPRGDYLSAWFLMIEREWERAIEELEAIPEPVWDAELYQPRALLVGYCLQQLGREREATDELAEAESVVRQAARERADWRFDASLAGIHALQGRRQEAHADLRRLADTTSIYEQPIENPSLAQSVAWVHVLIGEPDVAVSLLDRLFDGPANISRQALTSDPRWSGLQQRDDFRELLEKADAAERRYGLELGSPGPR